MNQERLRNLFIITILVIIILFSTILFAFNTIEGMIYARPYEYYTVFNTVI